MSNLFNITMDQGSTMTWTFTLTDSDGVTPYNLTGYDARLQVRRSYGATSWLINATLANGKLELTNAAGGVLTLTLLPSDTSGIKFNSTEDDVLECVYDLEIQSPLSKVYKPAKGTFTLNREVTR